MLTSLSAIRLAARHLAVGALIILAGCAGDDLLLPRDGAPAELRMVSGDQQTAPAGDPVEHPLVVEALDGAGRPVAGAVVIFGFVDQPNGAELEPENTETDDDGRASAKVTLGTPAGDQSVEARLEDPASDLRVQFRLTAVQPGGGNEGGDGDDGGGDGDDEGGNGDDEGGNGDDEGAGGGGGGGGGGDEGDDDDDDDDDDDEYDEEEEDDDGDDEGKGKGKGKGKGGG